MMTLRTKDFCLIAAIAGLVFFLNLGVPRLWDRDEPRNAGCAAEMLAANDWVTPVFNAELRTHKPILLYWFMMTAYSVFGINEFAARFWSAALGTGTLMIVYASGRRLFGRQTGLWSSIVLGTTLMFGVASRAATPDAFLIFFTTLALGIYIRFAFTTVRGEGNDSDTFSLNPQMYPEKFWQVALMFSAMGMAVLAKGPVGLVLPTAIIGMFLLIKRLPDLPEQPSDSTSWLALPGRLLRPFAPLHFLKTCWHMRPFTAIAVSAAVALPWYLWVHFRTNGQWTQEFFFVHNVSRATSAMEGHTGGPWYYPVALLVGFFPWSILWLPVLLDAVHGIRKKAASHDGYLLASCWAGVYLVLFSCARTKLPSYITPCYPGVALLTAAFVVRWSSRELILHRYWYRAAFTSLLFVGLITTIAVPIAAHLYLPGEEFLGGIGLIMMLGALLAWSQVELGMIRGGMQILAVTAVILLTAIMGVGTVRIDRHRNMDRLTQAVQADDSRTRIISFAKLEPSWVFYWKRPIREVKNPVEVARLLRESSTSDGKTAVITSASHLSVLEKQFSGNSLTIESIPYFLDDEDLVILKPKNQGVTSTALEESGRTIR